MTAVKSNYILNTKAKPLSPVKFQKKIKPQNIQRFEEKKLFIQNHLKNQPIYKFSTKTQSTQEKDFDERSNQNYQKLSKQIEFKKAK